MINDAYFEEELKWLCQKCKESKRTVDSRFSALAR